MLDPPMFGLNDATVDNQVKYTSVELKLIITLIYFQHS